MGKRIIQQTKRENGDAPGTMRWKFQARVNISSSQGSSPSHRLLGPSLWRTLQLTPKIKSFPFCTYKLDTFYLLSNANKYTLSVHFSKLNRVMKKHLDENISPFTLNKSFQPSIQSKSLSLQHFFLDHCQQLQSKVKVFLQVIFFNDDF